MQAKDRQDPGNWMEISIEVNAKLVHAKQAEIRRTQHHLTLSTNGVRPCQNPDEIKKAAGKLAMNYEHYLANQALPPVEGTDKAQLAERLGECWMFITLYAESTYQPW
ncbi:hypothetical protein F4604DRAFT_1901727 [Suillus subluteus]|nr:hypothetical protein F4604DRAFT_1901727 [Suillus subluteus]